jgi:hypothetical protein
MFRCFKPAQRDKNPANAVSMQSFVYMNNGYMEMGPVHLLLLASKQGVDGRAELLAALEEIEFEDEDVLDDLSTELLDERASCRCGATWVLLAFGCPACSSSARPTSGNDVVDDEDLLARLDSVGLHLEEVCAVLLHVLGRLAGTGQLALLADGHKGSAEAQGQRGAEEEAAGIEANNDVGLLGALGNVQLEGAQQRLVQRRIGEDGQDVLEQDAGGGEVGELAQGSLELYFKTGEFGGGGGMGGGESSLGGIALERRVGGLGWRVGSRGLGGRGHCEEEEGGTRGVVGE